ncbi:hypothetical protein U1Q18_019035 [Sarracenia purpurea var. burkii]
MIRGYCKAQLPVVGFSMFRRMVQEQVEMDRRSFVFALKACEMFHRIEVGKSVHCQIWKENAVDEALRFFDLMLSSGIEPNEVTMISVLSACSQKRDLKLGKSIHEYVKMENVVCTLNLRNALLDMYVKCGCLTTAREIFDKMETRDVFSWTSGKTDPMKSTETSNQTGRCNWQLHCTFGDEPVKEYENPNYAQVHM